MQKVPPLLLEGVRFDKPERLAYPDAGLRLGDVARYYHAVAPRLLMEAAGRPLSLLRCPDGIAGECFFQRHPGAGMGDRVHRVPLREKDGDLADYLYIDDVRGLLQLVRLGAYEFHAWGSPAATPDRPDRLVFDLDPGAGVPWTELVACARLIRDRLQAHGLRSFVRLSGGKGVHVVAPFAPGPDWMQAKAFCERIARGLAREQLQRYVASAGKRLRTGRIFIDWLRNTRSATSIANWSLRARPGAPVAMPLRWDELGASRSGGDYPMARALRRASRLRSDPWDGIATLRQSLPA
ncbi:DNA polymerase domain-containing protein [Pseudoxanthomonas kalamensis DSM 18571]|uniref:non-homologous end-joining DNA ligase n=1 Tax=Pseudoxanthomonas kalamensis TaxID=289483 RepID=UPI0013909A77|nr:non-homologous end-joining DNA ligase [Pseudoxanthomonas kalamensis]KAF1709331.1 DNA polymerase domain-containing protein [Pseudoxanthomonas kalamensis DSM 18571]